MSVNYCTLDVVQVCEVFECSLQQASFLTQLSYVSPVIMSKHLVSQDSICNLEVITKFHLAPTALSQFNVQLPINKTF